MKVLFRDKLKSYFSMAVLGLLAGFSVVFFIEVPDNSFWSFYYWSSSTFGFWMFSTSLIVLFSENRKCAAINAGIYIFLMFLITTVHQSFRLYRSGAMQPESLSQLLPNHIGGWLLYSVPPAFVCAVLGIILWSGRKNTIWGKLLRTMPAVFLFAETGILFYSVFVYHTRFFSALSDLVCFLAYSVIFLNRQELTGNKLSIKLAQLFFGSCTNLKTKTGQLPKDGPVCRVHYCFAEKPLICIFSVFRIAHIYSAWYNNHVMHS